MKRIVGSYEKLGDLAYFIPDQLPPQNPLLTLDFETIELYGLTMHRLGQLNEMAKRLPDIKRFIKAYVMKEAMLSSAIEGIHTTLMDVLTQPITSQKITKETQLVLNYTKALDVAIDMVQHQQLPIVSRVILGAHEALMSGGESDYASPGQYRKQAVRVGNLVPPLAPKVPELMAQLERFINANTTLPPLIKAGLAHVQFETIHPFLDGNGRIGRLLIVLMFLQDDLLSAPILYPSYYFKKHHMEYYVRLDLVRTEGDFEGWIRYYLNGISQSALDAYERAKSIELLESEILQQIAQSDLFTKIRSDAIKGLSALFQFPVTSVQELSHHLGKSYNATARLVRQFTTLGVLKEMSDQKRNRLFIFQRYIDLLEKEY